MKAVINGKTYNTETARFVCDLPCRANYGDFSWHDTKLYKTKKGAFFVAGRGNAASMWAESAGQNSWTGGSGVRPVPENEARDWMEAAGCGEDAYATAGLTVDEA